MIPPERVKGDLALDFIRPPDRRTALRMLLLDATDETIVAAYQFRPSKPVQYHGEIVLGAGYWGIWFLFKDRSFDIARVYRPDGTWTGYYVDVLEPVRWKASNPTTLEPVVDLFLDLWIAPDGKYIVLDEDEFDEAIGLKRITQAQADHARRVLQELREATERGEFPPPVVREFRL